MLECEAYAILGIEPNSTQEEIRRAFRKAVLLHHPDKGGDADMFKSVLEAHKTLVDMKHCDEQEVDIIMKLYKGIGRMYEIFCNTVSRTGLDIVLKLDVSLKEIYEGHTKKLNVKTYADRMLCNKTFYVPLYNFKKRHVYKGGGDANEQGIVGDLIVTFDVVDTNEFYIDDLFDTYDMCVTVVVDLYDVLAHQEKQLVLPSGKEISVSHPLNLSHHAVDVENCGLPYYEDNNDVMMRGKLTVRFDLVMRPTTYAYMDDSEFVDKLKLYFSQSTSLE